VKHLLTGLTVSRQYVCLPLENLPGPFSVFLTVQGATNFFDVTLTHVFLGYKPLIILLRLSENVIENNTEVCLNFVMAPFTPDIKWKGFPSDKRCIARLLLRKISTPLLAEGYCLYEGLHGEHQFLNPFHQFVNRHRENFRKQSLGNVGLPGNLYDQVRIAYSIPRIISLITVGDSEFMNMFPSDLHGPVGKRHYMSSLRIGGKANAQIEKQGKLALSFMPVDDFQMVYSLGKNHMQEMNERMAFQTDKLSIQYKIPLPLNALHYLELKRLHSFDVGIHRIHLYEVVTRERLAEGKTLAHIHQFYAQWRVDHNLPTPMLLH
jgi:flavin reductase (DIM6/NTAB) family NADH-FMN oxidoreductase RutF